VFFVKQTWRDKEAELCSGVHFVWFCLHLEEASQIDWDKRTDNIFVTRRSEDHCGVVIDTGIHPSIKTKPRSEKKIAFNMKL